MFESLVSCILIFPLKKSLKNVVCLLLAVLDLPCCAWAFSSFSDRGYSAVVVRGLLVAVASFISEQEH